MTRVLIATNQPVLAKGMEAALTAGGLEIAGICRDVFEVFEFLQRARADIAVLDEPVYSIPDIVSDLLRLAPRCLFVPWPRLSPTDTPERLVESIRLMAEFPAPDPSPARRVDLACSERERAIITLVGYGLNNEEIAAALGADRTSVRQCINELADRLGTGDRYELALYGLSTLTAQHTERSL